VTATQVPRTRDVHLGHFYISRSDLPPGLNVHRIMAISNANLAIYHVRV
jgi:hypothetical protein